METQATIHEVYFERMRLQPGKWRCYCTGCGWMWHGSEAECKTRAAGHDLEWLPMGTEKSKGSHA